VATASPASCSGICHPMWWRCKEACGKHLLVYGPSQDGAGSVRQHGCHLAGSRVVAGPGGRGVNINSSLHIFTEEASRQACIYKQARAGGGELSPLVAALRPKRKITCRGISLGLGRCMWSLSLAAKPWDSLPFWIQGAQASGPGNNWSQVPGCNFF